MTRSLPTWMSSGRRVEARFSRVGRGLEDALVGLAISLLAVLPIAEIAARKFFRTSLLNSAVYIQHLVLAAAFLAAAIASREKKHLSLAIDFPFKESLKSILRVFVGVLCASITLAFAMTAL